jgi:hypothetical protein
MHSWFEPAAGGLMLHFVIIPHVRTRMGQILLWLMLSGITVSPTVQIHAFIMFTLFKTGFRRYNLNARFANTFVSNIIYYYYKSNIMWFAIRHRSFAQSSIYNKFIQIIELRPRHTLPKKNVLIVWHTFRLLTFVYVLFSGKICRGRWIYMHLIR